MAQTGYTPIKIYASTTASATPSAGNLDNTNGAELAINITDGKLFYKDNLGAVQTIATKAGAAGSVTSVDVSGGTTGLTTSGGPVTTSGTITLAGTLAATNGGTAQSTYTTGDILYASASNTLSKLPVGTTGQVLTVSGGVPAWGTSSGGITTGKAIAMAMIFGF